MGKGDQQDLIEILKQRPTKENFKACVGKIKMLNVAERGEIPNPFRIPKEGTKGELWFRNSAFGLRTLPLCDGESFIVTHSEAPIYYEGKAGRVSADLLGLWHSKASTKLCVIELKAGEGGDNVIYALAEGLRNLVLHASSSGLGRLREGWKNNEKDETIKNAWAGGNPFMGEKGRLKRLCLLVIGDESWIAQQKPYKVDAAQDIEEIKKQFMDIDVVNVYSFNKKAKSGSKPYMLLPLRKWL